MAKKKRVTLPKNFTELIEKGDMEELIAVFEACELHATYDGRYGLNTALHCYGVPEDLVRFLVERGLDVNVPNYYGRTPLYVHATIGSEKVALFYELGGDIEKPDTYGNRPLHTAASFAKVKTVRFLMEKGADIRATNDRGQTPLESALSSCRNADISKVAEISESLLQAGAKINKKMKEEVKRIAEEFEFHRENFNKELLSEADAGLQKLYTLFGVEEVLRLKKHDGEEAIIVGEGSFEKQYEDLWNYLVPSSGAAKTMQGEVIRIPGRVRDELYRNGGANWDRDYRKMLQALIRYFEAGTALSEQELTEAKTLISGISGDGGDPDGGTERLMELAVLWIALNPEPIPLKKPEYNR